MALAWLLSLGLAAHAFEDRDVGVYAEGGHAPHGGGGTDVLALGVMLPWTPRQPVRGGALSFYADLYASQWRAPAAGGGRRSYAQLGAIATWRYRFDEGRSPWFAEAGVGASVLDGHYETSTRRFSTRFQFTEVLGVGRSFGARGAHEVSLRLQHFSNAGIRKPNPGENFVRLRYAFRF